MKRAAAFLVSVGAAVALNFNGLGQNPPAISQPKPDAEAQALVRDLLAQKPAKTAVVQGVLKTRNDDTKQRAEIKVTYTTQPGEESWRGIYETQATSQHGVEKLVVVHQGKTPSQYLYTRTSDPKNPTAKPSLLSGPAAAIPFAGTDFWLSDLGLEFLHWPEQRLIRNAKITMKLGRSCYLLESINPAPTGSNYARVISWIDRETGGLIYTEAFDQPGKRRPFKIFSLKRFAKNQVKEMEIQNERTNSRTRLEFSFDEN